MNQQSLFDLQGKVVVVTGATGHLGKAICQGLAEANAYVAICSTKMDAAKELADELKAIHSGQFLPVAFDLREPDQISEAIISIHDFFGRVDCLVNNAYFGRPDNMLAMSLENWNIGLHGGVTVHLLMMQRVIPHLEKTEGNIINIASMYGMVSPDPAIYENNPFANPVNYGAGKAALLQLTRYAAVHLAPKRIRVNAISPGPFPSPFVQKNEEFVDRLKKKTPLGRIGKPEELKGPVVFLASSAASYITGHNLVVDGGWTIW